MMRGMVVLLLLATIKVVQGVCRFPSELVGNSYQHDSSIEIPQVYTFSETQMIFQNEVGPGNLHALNSLKCIEKNGDFFLVGNGYGSFYCYKFNSTDSSKPQAYLIGSLHSEVYKSKEPFPQQLPLGCNIPIGCPVTTFGTPCTPTPTIILEGFCSKLQGILEEECSESSESSSSISSNEVGGEGGGRRGLRRHIKLTEWWRGKRYAKEKCKKYEELEALIKETCE